MIEEAKVSVGHDLRPPEELEKLVDAHYATPKETIQELEKIVPRVRAAVRQRHFDFKQEGKMQKAKRAELPRQKRHDLPVPHHGAPSAAAHKRHGDVHPARTRHQRQQHLSAVFAERGPGYQA